MQHATPATTLTELIDEIDTLTTIRNRVRVVGVKRWHLTAEAARRLRIVEVAIDAAVSDGIITAADAEALTDCTLEDWWRITAWDVGPARIWSDGRSSGWCIIDVDGEITDERLSDLIADQDIDTLTRIRDAAATVVEYRDGFGDMLRDALNHAISESVDARIAEVRHSAELTDAVQVVRMCALILMRDADAVRHQAGRDLERAADVLNDAIGGAR